MVTILSYPSIVTGIDSVIFSFRLLQNEVTQESIHESNPALFPGWHGSFNRDAAAHANIEPKNLAIKGLYSYIDPAGAEAAALEADGYQKTDWGIKVGDGYGIPNN